MVTIFSQVPEKEVRVHAPLLQIVLCTTVHLRKTYLFGPLQSEQTADDGRFRNSIRLLLFRRKLSTLLNFISAKPPHCLSLYFFLFVHTYVSSLSSSVHRFWKVVLKLNHL